MHPCEQAAAILERELEKVGLPRQEGTSDWFLYRAKSMGLTLLRGMVQEGVHTDTFAAEQYRKDFRQGLISPVEEKV